MFQKTARLTICKFTEIRKGAITLLTFSVSHIQKNTKLKMMKNVKFALALAALFLSAFSLQAQNLDEILKKHFEVTGAKKAEEIKSMVITAKTSAMGMAMPMVVKSKPKENKVYTEVSVQGMKIITVINGDEGWMINPMQGNKPQPLTKEQLDASKKQYDGGNPLLNYKEEGHTVELKGKEDLEGVEVYKIFLKEKDGTEVMSYMDAENYVIIKTESKVTVDGKVVESSMEYSDFKEVTDGIVMATSMTVPTPMGKAVTTFEKIEIDVDIDDSVFEKP